MAEWWESLIQGVQNTLPTMEPFKQYAPQPPAFQPPDQSAGGDDDKKVLAGLRLTNNQTGKSRIVDYKNYDKIRADIGDNPQYGLSTVPLYVIENSDGVHRVIPQEAMPEFEKLGWRAISNKEFHQRQYTSGFEKAMRTNPAAAVRDSMEASLPPEVGQYRRFVDQNLPQVEKLDQSLGGLGGEAIAAAHTFANDITGGGLDALRYDMPPTFHEWLDKARRTPAVFGAHRLDNPYDPARGGRFEDLARAYGTDDPKKLYNAIYGSDEEIAKARANVYAKMWRDNELARRNRIGAIAGHAGAFGAEMGTAPAKALAEGAGELTARKLAQWGAKSLDEQLPGGLARITTEGLPKSAILKARLGAEVPGLVGTAAAAGGVQAANEVLAPRLSDHPLGFASFWDNPISHVLMASAMGALPLHLLPIPVIGNKKLLVESETPGPLGEPRTVSLKERWGEINAREAKIRDAFKNHWEDIKQANPELADKMDEFSTLKANIQKIKDQLTPEEKKLLGDLGSGTDFWSQARARGKARKSAALTRDELGQSADLQAQLHDTLRMGMPRNMGELDPYASMGTDAEFADWDPLQSVAHMSKAREGLVKKLEETADPEKRARLLGQIKDHDSLRNNAINRGHNIKQGRAGDLRTVEFTPRKDNDSFDFTDNQIHRAVHFAENSPKEASSVEGVKGSLETLRMPMPPQVVEAANNLYGFYRDWINRLYKGKGAIQAEGAKTGMSGNLDKLVDDYFWDRAQDIIHGRPIGGPKKSVTAGSAPVESAEAMAKTGNPRRPTRAVDEDGNPRAAAEGPQPVIRMTQLRGRSPEEFKAAIDEANAILKEEQASIRRQRMTEERDRLIAENKKLAAEQAAEEAKAAPPTPKKGRKGKKSRAQERAQAERQRMLAERDRLIAENERLRTRQYVKAGGGPKAAAEPAPSPEPGTVDTAAMPMPDRAEFLRKGLPSDIFVWKKIVSAYHDQVLHAANRVMAFAEPFMQKIDDAYGHIGTNRPLSTEDLLAKMEESARGLRETGSLAAADYVEKLANTGRNLVDAIRSVPRSDPASILKADAMQRRLIALHQEIAPDVRQAAQNWIKDTSSPGPPSAEFPGGFPTDVPSTKPQHWPGTGLSYEGPRRRDGRLAGDLLASHGGRMIRHLGRMATSELGGQLSSAIFGPVSKLISVGNPILGLLSKMRIRNEGRATFGGVFDKIFSAKTAEDWAQATQARVRKAVGALRMSPEQVSRASAARAAGTRSTMARAVGLAFLNEGDHKIKGSDREGLVEAVTKKIHLIDLAAANPDQIEQAVWQKTGPIRAIDPALGERAVDMVKKTIDFLRSKMPHDPKAGIFGPRQTMWRPSDQDATKAARYIIAAANPVDTLLQEIHDGNVNAETVETMEALQPGTLSFIQQSIMEALDKFPQLDYSKRLSISKALGIPLEPMDDPEVSYGLSQYLGHALAAEQQRKAPDTGGYSVSRRQVGGLATPTPAQRLRG